MKRVVAKYPVVTLLIIGGFLSVLVLGNELVRHQSPAGEADVSQRSQSYQAGPALAGYRDFIQKPLTDGRILVTGGSVDNQGSVVFLSDRGAAVTSTAIHSFSYTSQLVSGAPKQLDSTSTSINVGYALGFNEATQGIRFAGLFDEDCVKAKTCKIEVFSNLGDGGRPLMSIVTTEIPKADLEAYVIADGNNPLDIMIGKDLYQVDMQADLPKLVKAIN